MDDPLDQLEDLYVQVFTSSLGGLGVSTVCRRCGAYIHQPGKDDASPTTRDVHDRFHEVLDEHVKALKILSGIVPALGEADHG